MPLINNITFMLELNINYLKIKHNVHNMICAIHILIIIIRLIKFINNIL